MYDSELLQAYQGMVAAWQAVVAAGGSARCNGEWGRWYEWRARVQQLEEIMAYETRVARAATAAPHQDHRC